MMKKKQEKKKRRKNRMGKMKELAAEKQQALEFIGQLITLHKITEEELSEYWR